MGEKQPIVKEPYVALWLSKFGHAWDNSKSHFYGIELAKEAETEVGISG